MNAAVPAGSTHSASQRSCARTSAITAEWCGVSGQEPTPKEQQIQQTRKRRGSTFSLCGRRDHELGLDALLREGPADGPHYQLLQVFLPKRSQQVRARQQELPVLAPHARVNNRGQIVVTAASAVVAGVGVVVQGCVGVRVYVGAVAVVDV